MIRKKRFLIEPDIYIDIQIEGNDKEEIERYLQHIVNIVHITIPAKMNTEKIKRPKPCSGT